MAAVSMRGVSKSYGSTAVVKQLDLEVKDGEFMVFVGPSGCGKSTMLRMIAGLEDITSGELFIDGVRANALRPAERGAAMVFQSYALYPHMTVADNMGFALKMQGVPKAERDDAVQRAAQSLHITELLQRTPKQLSGGQRQRVAIGRAIVRKPKVFLFDEPLSNLDASLRVSMRIELSRLHQELRTTMIYVTHDQVEAMTLGDRIAVFNQGRIEQVGAPLDLYNRPRNEFVAGFLGAPRINLVPRPAEGASAPHRALWQALVDPSHFARAERAGLRPEHLHLGAPGTGIAATVELVEQLGDAAIVHLRVAGLAELLIAKVSAAEGRVNAGDAIGLLPAVETVLIFDDQGQRVAGGLA